MPPFNITIDPSKLGSDSSFTDSDVSVHVAPPPVTGSHSYLDPYDEWAGIPYPGELKPSDSARRPWTNAREKPKPESPESPESVDSAEEYGPPCSNRNNDYLICTGGKDQDKDITVHLNIEAGLDLSHDLGRLARLSRLGHFYQAAQLFEDRLAPHVDFFPVVAEFADLLLEQGDFGQLSKFISSRLTDPHVKYSDEEVLLLKVIKSLAEIYTRGAVIPALEMSTEALKHLTSNHRSQSLRHIAGSQIQLVEACVRIIAFAAAHSNFLESERFQSLLHWSSTDDGLIRGTNDDEDYYRMPPPPPPPLRSSRTGHARYRSDNREFQSKRESSRHRPAGRGNASQRKYPQIGPWYRLLVQEGFLWESHRILRAVLPLFASIQGHYVDDGSFEEFAQLDDISKAGEVFLQPKGAVTDDEQALLTEFANACLLARFLNDGSTLEAVRTTHSQFFKKSHSLASAILSAHPHLIKSRTYLDWALSESTGELSTICQLSDNQQRSVAERWPHDIPSGVQSLHPRDQSIVEAAGLTQTLSDPWRYRNLDIISASARELGDYRLEKAVLQKVYQLSRDFEQRLQAVQARARLQYDTLQNALEYLSCLIDEFRLLNSGDSTGREGMRKDLQRRLAEFNASFPFRFDHNETLRQKSAIVFFDNPLLKRMEREVSYLLLKSLGRDVEAELARVQLADVEHHLPGVKPSPLQPPAVHDERGNYSSLAQTPVAATEKKNEPPVRWRSPRAILPESHRSGDATDDVVQDLEKQIMDTRKQLAEEKRKKREANEKLKLAEERAGAAEASTHAMPGAAQQLITLKDPAGREFLFPFEQCRSFTAFEVLMQRVLVHDSILSQHISKGDYELIGPGGNPVSRVDWDSAIQPGSTITMHSKPDSGQEPSQAPEKEDDDDWDGWFAKTETKSPYKAREDGG